MNLILTHQTFNFQIYFRFLCFFVLEAEKLVIDVNAAARGKKRRATSPKTGKIVKRAKPRGAQGLEAGGNLQELNLSVG